MSLRQISINSTEYQERFNASVAKRLTIRALGPSWGKAHFRKAQYIYARLMGTPPTEVWEMIDHYGVKNPPGVQRPKSPRFW